MDLNTYIIGTSKRISLSSHRSMALSTNTVMIYTAVCWWPLIVAQVGWFVGSVAMATLPQHTHLLAILRQTVAVLPKDKIPLIKF